jgi:lysyl-tRNA synthetase, class I
MSEKGSWPLVEANKIISAKRKEGPFVLETGFGASGLPHIGTFGEIAKTNFVKMALEEIGHKGGILSFIDDLDGLRKVPLGFPDSVRKDLGKPVSKIEDPFGCCESYSHHMFNKLLEMLEIMPEVKAEHKLSSEEYAKGTFNEQIKQVFDKREIVESIILPTLSEETRLNWFPFFVICEKCGRIYTTRITGHNKANYTVSYECNIEYQDIPACGYKGERSALNGGGKLPWRLDWAARWAAFKVDYEIFGKDLIESWNIGKLLMKKVFEVHGPVTMFYELFLDKNGSKISKSKGDSLSPTIWLKYASIPSLLLLNFKKPRIAKRLYPEVIPQYMNEALEHFKNFSQKSEAEKKDEVFHFISFGNPEKYKPLQVDYSGLCNLISALGTTDYAIIINYLKNLLPENYSPTKEEFNELLSKVANYYQDIIIPELTEQALDEDYKPLVTSLIDFLKVQREAEEIQTHIFDLAKNSGKEPKDFFKILYKLILKQEMGPRMGDFIKIIGEDKAIGILEKYI